MGRSKKPTSHLTWKATLHRDHPLRRCRDATPPLFFDTMCLSHFARADRLDVLRDLLIEREPWTTTVVRSELAVGARIHTRLGQTLTLDWMRVASLDTLEELGCFVKWANRLGSQEMDLGEASVLAAAELQHGIAITDDRDATNVARRYGADVHGTIWLLAAACREGKLTLVGRKRHRGTPCRRGTVAM
jgi:predicted nucleic acid-binding protein